MKALPIILVSLLLLIVSPLHADEVTYRASMTGIECAGCKKTIAKAIGKLDGVKTIRIEKGSGDKYVLTVKTDGSAPLSKSDATGALGKDAPHYQIVSWSKTN